MTEDKYDSSQLLARYQPYRRYVEIGFWVITYLLNAIINSAISIYDVERAQLQFEHWQPAVWEISSAVAGLCLIPAIIAFERRYPLYIGVLRKHVPMHLLGSVIYCVLHVVGMVCIRKLIYLSQGQTYDFGNWPLELAYEYLKDWRSYLSVLLVLGFYHLLLLRLQGEARILDTADDDADSESTQRPDRFLVKKLGKEFLISADDIEYLQASGNYVNLHLHNRDYPLRSTMSGIEPRMNPSKFVRVHRSYMVNLDFIQEIEPLDTGDARIVMKNGSIIPCSRRYRPALK